MGADYVPHSIFQMKSDQIVDVGVIIDQKNAFRSGSSNHITISQL